MSLLKVLLLIPAGVALENSLTPPHARPAPEERLKAGSWEIAAPFLHIIVKGGYWTFTLCETIITCAALYPSSAISQAILDKLIRSSDPVQALQRVQQTPELLIGTCCLLVGNLIRTQCYRALGKMFTFELSIRKTHELVTSGPYSVVRHPSYTGATFAIAGIAFCHLNRGSWLVNCSGLFPEDPRSARNVMYLLWAAHMTVFHVAMRGRMKKEDGMLERAFGQEWRDWAKRVPYWLIPRIY
ncbi:hypothetical protein SERLA73DRAFT_190798 [Serpula lacrymans var. lacrymans S7.3]|uniref:Uncharacterized protein n=2 Tax=Serpula lacrymans var. lacrymans TaxID=341189 RepID=F8QGE0_SERL3|nr:uncharacterized protein SERLADRAFT_459511 [Serpula lacrymans var. lacrymans S7.9]EGN92618.1 hypothetical protein SERLA73DRAFT_190798 [Serpula lacrymans var. lacrymans S7.3]EGO28750.1 hypothetical protein SERLADRAFT_459511 [Serpula lacrymans var. lacrymans S7.9]